MKSVIVAVSSNVLASEREPSGSLMVMLAGSVGDCAWAGARARSAEASRVASARSAGTRVLPPPPPQNGGCGHGILAPRGRRRVLRLLVLWGRLSIGAVWVKWGVLGGLVKVW